MENYKKLLLGILSGVLLALAYPPYPFFLLAFIAFIPLLYALEQNVKKPYLIAYITFFIYHGLTNWWIGSWQPNSDTFLMIAGVVLAFIHPLFFLIPVFCYNQIKRKFGAKQAAFSFPFIWISFEWLHSFGDLGYPWLTIGYTQIYNHIWVQFADIAGVWGVSFVICIINVILFSFVLFLKNNNYKLSDYRIFIKNPVFIKYSITILLLIVLPCIYGMYSNIKYSEKSFINHKTARVGIIQPNINSWLKWESSLITQFDKYKKIQDSLINSTDSLDLIIWPETAIHYLSTELNVDKNFSILNNWIDLSKSNLLAGFCDINLYELKDNPPKEANPFKGDTSILYLSYNSALMLEKNKNHQIYHKMKLTPFSERLPFLEILSFAKKWFEWGVGISSWAYGKEQKNLSFIKNNDTIKVAPIICIESIHPKFVADFADLGADFYAIITNDAWYDNTFGPEQHFLIAAMRAIESRRYIARCANSGISGFIAPNGKTVELANQYQATAIWNNIPLIKEKSLYSQYGDLLTGIATGFSFAWVLLSFFIKKR